MKVLTITELRPGFFVLTKDEDPSAYINVDPKTCDFSKELGSPFYSSTPDTVLRLVAEHFSVKPEEKVDSSTST